MVSLHHTKNCMQLNNLQVQRRVMGKCTLQVLHLLQKTLEMEIFDLEKRSGEGLWERQSCSAVDLATVESVSMPSIST
jgi:hypothetical protein